MRYFYRIPSRLLWLVFLVQLFIACSENQATKYSTFSEWRQANTTAKLRDCAVPHKSISFSSRTLNIDGIAKSMTGDIDEIDAQVDWSNSGLIWLTGAQVSILSDNIDVGSSDEFLCHSLVNFHRKSNLPWTIPTNGTDKRLFTFSQGISDVKFPEGFGIPIMTNTKLSLGNQVLNLTKPKLKSEVEFLIRLNYLEFEENCNVPKVLYQQPIFVVKRTGGPQGAYNSADTAISVVPVEKAHYYDTSFAQCGISYEEGYNPYRDNFGRVFNGHWTITKDSIEVIATNVTPMLDLKNDATIHAISMHVHPHSYSLELIDKTTNTTLYKGRVHYENENLTRIKKLDFYSSKEGIKVFKDHEYQLVSTYLNPDGEDDITAMATLFLYMTEQN